MFNARQFMRACPPCTALLQLIGFGDTPLAAWKPTITVSKETTFLEGPIDANGRVDVCGAINARLSEGVKPDENAAAVLAEAIGPGPIPPNLRVRKGVRYRYGRLGNLHLLSAAVLGDGCMGTVGAHNEGGKVALRSGADPSGRQME